MDKKESDRSSRSELLSHPGGSLSDPVVRRLMNALPVGVLALDAEACIVDGNARAFSLLRQWSGMDAPGCIDDAVLPEDRIQIDGAFRELRSGETDRAMVDVRTLVQGDEETWARIRIASSGDGDGTETTFVATVEDVSLQKRGETRLKSAKDAAERATQTKSEFLANMSHEIRTPLHTILGMTELMLETSLDQEQSEYATQVRFSAEVLLGLINDILDFSKIEAGKLSLEYIEFDLRQTMEEAVDMLSLEAHKKSLDVVLDLSPSLPDLVVGDPIRIRQVVVNLFSNAVKFTSSGQIMIRARPLEVSPEAAGLRIEVSDTGIGIPMDKLNQLFRAFTQVDSSTTRKFGGTGLGLSISRNLVKMMGGIIGVASQEGRGSSFWFSVPVDVVNWKRIDRRESVLSGRRVLVVDDNESSRRALVSYVTASGAQCGEAADGPRALEMLRAEDTDGYDVALVDLEMPGMDGWQLASEINADKRINSTRLVLMSPRGSTTGEPKMKLLGWFDAYINKPIRYEELLESLETILSSDFELAAAEDKNAAISRSETASTTGVPTTARILVAEDHIVNQQLFRTILEKQGHTVFLADNGRKALEALESQPVDLLFMDVQMPEMNGYDATREIRRLGYSIPIVAVTANALKGEREKCLDAGMNDFLTKPFKSADILPVLQRWLKPAASGEVPEALEEVAEVEEVVEAAGDLAAAPEAASEEPILDFDQALEAFMGQREIVEKVLADFDTKVAEQIQLIRNNVPGGDLERARTEAHGIKGGSWNLAAYRLGNAAAELEDILSRRAVDEAPESIDRVEAAYKELRGYLSQIGITEAAG
jgi:two-component system, sensor histidine kinase and response regulator